MKKNGKAITFGQVVASLRAAAGFTGQGLVDAMRAAGRQFSNSYLSDIEHGNKVPPEDTARALAICLGADPDYLVLLAGTVPHRIRKKGFHPTASKKAVRELER